ncbi:MAG TPA: ABC transporter permease [Methylomirabilota bacterium]|nr:ABC transporter permease [Methylomirabilota bacterium]
MTTPGALAARAADLDEPAGREFWRRFGRSRNACLGGALVVLVTVAAVAAPWLVPYGYENTDLLAVWAEPSRAHLLGGDALGRDVLSRLIVGARVSLVVAVSVLALTLTVGTLAGMVAGYFGGWVDTALMRSADIVFAFPELILAILVAAMLGPGMPTVVVALAIVWWPGIARLTRSLTLALRSELFVDAAVVSATRPFRILVRHVLPNIVPPLIVRASIGVGFIVMAEATLSFLGIGVQEPLPTWGGMIRDGLVALRTEPYLALSASAALGVTIVGFNLLGDGLRDLLDPRVRDR